MEESWNVNQVQSSSCVNGLNEKSSRNFSSTRPSRTQMKLNNTDKTTTKVIICQVLIDASMVHSVLLQFSLDILPHSIVNYRKFWMNVMKKVHYCYVLFLMKSIQQEDVVHLKWYSIVINWIKVHVAFLIWSFLISDVRDSSWQKFKPNLGSSIHSDLHYNQENTIQCSVTRAGAEESCKWNPWFFTGCMCRMALLRGPGWQHFTQ